MKEYAGNDGVVVEWRPDLCYHSRNCVRALPSANGPLLVRGPIKIVDADGNVVQELEKAAFCRCGGSQNKPFCDGTHKTIGFVA